MKKLLITLLTFMGVACMAFEITPDGFIQIEGSKYPAMGFGTYPLTDKIAYKSVQIAENYGYRIFDTATFYQNFEPIGAALNPLGRENFYIISKVWPDSHTPELLKKDLNNTLKSLNTSYVDAYFLHWPNSKIPLNKTLSTLNEFRLKGLIRHIGLSNVTVNHLKKALKLNIPIAWVQVEMSPKFCDFELLKFCQENGITVQAWAPLSRGMLSQDQYLNELGSKYNKTASQIALRWIFQHQALPLPSSSNKKHIQENMNIFDFSLSQNEMDAIDARAKAGKRERYGLDEFDYTYEQVWPK